MSNSNEMENNNHINSDKSANHHQTCLIDEFLLNALKQEFIEDLNTRLNIEKCAICNRLTQQRYLKHLGSNLPSRTIQILQEIIDRHTPLDSVKLCKDHCHKDLIIQGSIPKYSKLNNVYFDECPNEISSLNIFERLLIQKAKVFQTIVKLKSYSSNFSKNAIPALKGLAIHLPLNNEHTNQFIINTLPNYEALNIFIESLPTKNNIVWRSLVDLKKVFCAIQWLKLNHPLYQNIIVDKQSNINLYKSLTFVKNDTNTFYEIREMSNIQQRDTIPNLTQFTVMDLEKCDYNIPDIQKYTCKRINTTPLNATDKNIDIYCFPDIFPYGRAGMYENRPVRISPAMFARIQLMNQNPNARRNIQYIFSLLNNKDIRAAESGIYATLNATYATDLNNQNFQKKIAEEDKDTELNLRTVMTAVSNSKEYWAQVSSDLKAYNRHKGPATFFGTISPAEYNWQELYSFLMNNTSDLPRARQLSLSELINLEPMLVTFFLSNDLPHFSIKLYLIINIPYLEK